MHHHRTHDLLLIKKLLEFRDNASPCTIILDSLKQSGKQLVREVIAGGIVGFALPPISAPSEADSKKKSKAHIIFISCETLRAPQNISTFIDASVLDFRGLAQAINKRVATLSSTERTILIFDALNTLLHRANASTELPAFLSSLITPKTSVVAVYHLDVPVPHDASAYGPAPLTILKYLATTLLTTHSLSQVIASQEARLRSVAEPSFGLMEEREGVVVGLQSNDSRGAVVETEHRRKSGRAIHQIFFVSQRSSTNTGPAAVILLEDHPDYKATALRNEVLTNPETEADVAQGTFSLGLTDRQRRDREGVVLPYFDAQKEGGVGEGGRILYDMGMEDDFDEEEDEI